MDRKRRNSLLFIVIFIISISKIGLTLNSIGLGQAQAIREDFSDNQRENSIDFHSDNGFNLKSSGSNPNNWTILIYLDGDNDIEQYAINDFLEMSSVGSDCNIHIVAQFDRASGYDSSYGDWTTTKRFHITNGMTPTAANALSDLGEIKEISSELVKNGLTQDELHRAIAPSLTSIKDMLRKNTYWLDTVLTGSEKHPQQIDWSRTITKDYASITREEISDMAGKYLDNHRAASIIVKSLLEVEKMPLWPIRSHEISPRLTRPARATVNKVAGSGAPRVMQ